MHNFEVKQLEEKLRRLGISRNRETNSERCWESERKEHTHARTRPYTDTHIHNTDRTYIYTDEKHIRVVEADQVKTRVNTLKVVENVEKKEARAT